jgi:nicotinate phosphoribosyltransferase
LDDAGLQQVQIVATSGFDEFESEKALSGGATIDAFGVGTKLGVSADMPYVDMVYKLSSFDGRNVKKTSPGKISLAGEKQVFRKTDRTGRYVADILGTRNERINTAEPLLIKVMENGLRIHAAPTLQEIRKRIQTGFLNLDDGYKSLLHPHRYSVRISPRLSKFQ